MAAHTGTMQLKKGIGKAWLAITAFAVAAALVVALVAMQGGSPAPSAPAKVQTQTHLDVATTSGHVRHVDSSLHRLVCARCAP